jgi:SAM-dependent methyltransferase
VKNVDSLDRFTQLRVKIEKLKNNDCDPQVRRFCEAIIEDSVFYRLADNVFTARPLLEKEHLIFLVFVSLQYLTNFRYDESYAFKTHLRNDLQFYSKEIEGLCASRNVCTNVPERYVGLQIISSILFHNSQSPLTVIDIGCSLGLGLMALNTPYFLDNIEIHRTLLPAVKMQPMFNKVIGIDVQKPDIKWLQASYLPEAKSKRNKVKQVYDSINNTPPPVTILKGDALNIEDISELSKGCADLVWISNTCYQVEGDVRRVIRGVQSLLKPRGIWLYAYYRHDIDEVITAETNPYVVKACVKNENFIDNSWLNSNGYISGALEVLEAPNELVPSIKPGVNFLQFLSFSNLKYKIN